MNWKSSSIQRRVDRQRRNRFFTLSVFSNRVLNCSMKAVYSETRVLQMVLENRVSVRNTNSIFTWSPVFVSVATEHVLVDSDYCHCWPFVVAEGMECARTEVLLWSSVAHLPFFPRNFNRSKESHQSFAIFWVDAEDHWLHVCFCWSNNRIQDPSFERKICCGSLARSPWCIVLWLGSSLVRKS